MDPFSITVGIVGLADAGTSLASFLTEKYKSYRDAPELILEVAHEVEFCAGLVDMFGSSLDRPGVEHPKRFVRDAKVLVEKTQQIFKEIEKLIPVERNFDATFSKARWHYALDRKKLVEKQQRLRQVQQMFMFMETMHRYHYSSSSGTGAGSSVGDGAGGMGVNAIRDPNAALGGRDQTFTGLLQQQGPVQMTGRGSDGQVFQVTLTLSPTHHLEPRHGSSKQPASVPFSSSCGTDELPGTPASRARSSAKPEKERQNERRLEGLRRSPFFDMSLLGERRPVRASAPFPISQETYSAPIEPRMGMTYWEKEKLRAELVQRTKAKERRKDEGGFSWDAVGDITARRDVEELRRLWFGDVSDSDEFPAQDSPGSPPESPYDEVEILGPLPPGEQPCYLDKGEEVPYRSDVRTVYPVDPPPVAAIRPYPKPDPKYSRYGTSDTIKGASSYVGQRSTNQVICDGCDREIRPSYPRMRCRSCPPSFDLCVHCFANPDTTLKHTHPKSHFVRESVSG